MGLGLALPSMLWWLAAAIIPVVLARLAIRQPRLVRWGASDLVAAAARSSRLTRGGLPWLLVLVRGLVLASAALAAARPIWQPTAAPTGPRSATVGRQLVAGGGDGRIAILAPPHTVAAPHDDDAAAVDASLAIRRALESLAGFPGTRGAASPPVVQLSLRDLPLLPIVPRTLLILCDQPPLDETDARRLTAAVEKGAGLLVCLGPRAIGDDDGRRGLSAWLDDLVGITVAGRLPLDDSPIEVIDELGAPLGYPLGDELADTPAGARTAGFVPLAGPAATAAAELVGGHAATVLARTAPEGRPLLVEARRGRGTVCVSAVPMSLSMSLPTGAATAGRDGAADGWSDLAAWPAFIPFVDRLVARLLAATSAPEKPAIGDGPSAAVTGVPRPPTMPLAPVLLATATACLLADAWLSSRAASGESRDHAAPLPRAGRAAMLAILATMGLAWVGRTDGDRRPTSRQRPVALLIDRSPSMAGRGAAATTTPVSRLAAVVAALTGTAGPDGPLGRIVRDRPVSVLTAADDVTPLGGSPAGVGGVTAAAPGTATSRLGDAVVGILAPRDDDRGGVPGQRPAAIVIASDGAITAGDSWRMAARAAARSGVPLVAIPTPGVDDPDADTVPPGFRVTAVRAPRLCHAAEPFAIDVEAEATASAGPLEISLAADASGPTLTRAPLASSPAADGMSARFTGRLSVPAGSFAAGSRLVSPRLVIGRPGDEPSTHPPAAVTTCPLAVTDAPVRVLMIEVAPRFEYRFLERLLARDRAFTVETCMLDPQASGRSPSAQLPRTTAAWNGFDVVILGDVPAGSDAGGRAEAWRTLREAAAADGIGIAWLPGDRSWTDPDDGLAWLSASPGGVAPPSVAHRLRATTGGRSGDWLPAIATPAADGPHAGGAFHPEVFAVLRPATLGPAARIVATAVASDAVAESDAAPAVLVDRLGAATILGHLCETWRWRRQDARFYEAYWRHAIRRLAAPHQLGRLFSATIDVQPPAPEAGDAVRIVITPARPTTETTGWRLELSSRPLDAPPRDAADTETTGTVTRIALPAAGLGNAAAVTIADLPAGVHTVTLVAAAPPADALDGGDLARDASPAGARAPDILTPDILTHDLLVSASRPETAGGPAATAALEAAAVASGGDVVGLDSIATLPEAVAAAVFRAEQVASPTDPAAAAPAWPGSIVIAHLLMLALACAAVAAWRQPRGMPGAGRLAR